MVAGAFRKEASVESKPLWTWGIVLLVGGAFVSAVFGGITTLGGRFRPEQHALFFEFWKVGLLLMWLAGIGLLIAHFVRKALVRGVWGWVLLAWLVGGGFLIAPFVHEALVPGVWQVVLLTWVVGIALIVVHVVRKK